MVLPYLLQMSTYSYDRSSLMTSLSYHRVGTCFADSLSSHPSEPGDYLAWSDNPSRTNQGPLESKDMHAERERVFTLL